MVRTVRLLGMLILILGVLLSGGCQRGDDGAATPLADPEIDRFVRWWGLEQDYYKKNHWLGIQTLQNPLDAWIIQEVIHEVRPDFIIEAGTFRGAARPSGR